MQFERGSDNQMDCRRGGGAQRLTSPNLHRTYPERNSSWDVRGNVGHSLWILRKTDYPRKNKEREREKTLKKKAELLEKEGKELTLAFMKGKGQEFFLKGMSATNVAERGGEKGSRDKCRKGLETGRKWDGTSKRVLREGDCVHS